MQIVAFEIVFKISNVCEILSQVSSVEVMLKRIKEL